MCCELVIFSHLPGQTLLQLNELPWNTVALHEIEDIALTRWTIEILYYDLASKIGGQGLRQIRHQRRNGPISLGHHRAVNAAIKATKRRPVPAKSRLPIKAVRISA